MFAILVVYNVARGALPPLAVRQEYRVLLMGQAGYRRRLELRADAWAALAELFIFATPEAVDVALASVVRREFVARHPACGATAAALLVREEASRGLDEVVLVRRSRAGADVSGLERFKLIAPSAVLW